MLGMPEPRVRELAREALVELAPISAQAVEEDWRGQLADYVLGQQAGPEATATRGHMRRSEAARSWTRSLVDSLEQLYTNGDLPAIPEGDRGRDRKPRRAAEPEPEGAEPAPAAAPRLVPPGAAAAIRRRWIPIAAALAVLILVAVLVWPIGVLTGDDDNSGGSGSDRASNSSSISTNTQGSAIIARQNGKTQIVVTAQGLKPSSQSAGSAAYQVWLYNSASDRKSLGATVTNQQGVFQAITQLPANYQRYQFIDMNSVTTTGTGKNQRIKNGPSVLRGILQLSKNPVSQGTGKNQVTVLAQIALKPLPGSGG
jgi:hypothetical protein